MSRRRIQKIAVNGSYVRSAEAPPPYRNAKEQEEMLQLVHKAVKRREGERKRGFLFKRKA